MNVFNTDTMGVGLRFGIPLNENDSIQTGLGIENTKIELGPNSPQRNIDFVNEFGSSTINVPVTASWRRDGRDSAIWTTSGTTQRAFAEVGMPAGDLTYYKVSYDLRWYYPLTDTFTLMLNGEAARRWPWTRPPLLQELLCRRQYFRLRLQYQLVGAAGCEQQSSRRK